MSSISRIRWTESAIAHIFRHGVLPSEVEDVAFGGECLIRTGRGGLHYLLGRTAGGKYLFIVVRNVRKGEVKVVTARPMNDWEKSYYKRRGK